MAIRSAIDNGGGAPAPGGAPVPVGDAGEVLKQLTRTRKKIETMEESLQNRLSVMANEVNNINNLFLIKYKEIMIPLVRFRH